MAMLAELQARWCRAVLAERVEDPVLAVAIRADGIAPEHRLKVHRNHFRLSLAAALAATFPTVVALAGPDRFAASARAFATAHPPQGPCLFEYGAAFPAFLRDSGLAATQPWVPDCAALDWAVNSVHHAEEGQAPDRAALARLPPEDHGRLRFRFVPALALLHSDWPLTEIWQAVQAGAAAELRPDRAAAPCRLAVHRSGWGWDTLWRRLGAAEYALFRALQAGATLQAALEAAPEDPAFDLAACLGWAVQAGLFAGFDIGPAMPA